MRKLYITHRPGELAIAFVFLELLALAAFLAWKIDVWFMRWCLVHAVVGCAYLLWGSLFSGMGSYERREAAESVAPTKEEASHG
ncbi:hypothetical protein QRO08_15930 [Paracidovorax citrulli]|uniref:Transmembrane protein n=2 Tax=Paracidovorax citrulli TaxID=80869 RepID=A1TN01_PARC0|nr:hypothetical protein [Paracidovorax citrulli]ABM32339.1 hypothetical protein Aave_1752 [Paracidovorax citrulli AAC00-1]ATG94643.1 hypothetical protein CQB05_11915 [Paracidovorax citrulli]MVT28526.1 hypothetical protein [Paracidovorax citrulli]PVY66549.1 hypothetical protein C8E08_3958 [Paracidovorax citrulli]REG69282.1 hypothetical protein C8E07_2429 [Paracidovorax citrulli]